LAISNRPEAHLDELSRIGALFCAMKARGPLASPTL
jgi:hypothetical protein